jgi:hypothetical protein
MKIINTHHAEFLSLNFYLIISDKEPEEPLVIPAKQSTINKTDNYYKSLRKGLIQIFLVSFLLIFPFLRLNQ